MPLPRFTPNILTLWMALAMVVMGCVHAPRPPERRVYLISESTDGVGSDSPRGVGGSGAEAYCNELQKTCFKTCWRRKPELESIPKHSAQHDRHCTEKCRREFMKCVEQQEQLERQDVKKELRFQDIGTALVWLGEHKTELELGTMVVVAGVAFTVAVSAAGALVLAPL